MSYNEDLSGDTISKTLALFTVTNSRLLSLSILKNHLV